jgi:hypothetical protein
MSAPMRLLDTGLMSARRCLFEDGIGTEAFAMPAIAARGRAGEAAMEARLP